jgi:hypothetical protein
MKNEKLISADSIRERLLAEGLIGESVSLVGADFCTRMLTDDEKKHLQGADTCQLMEDLFYAPIRWLFEGPHSLACLGDNVPARLFRAMTEDGVVFVGMDDGSVSKASLRGAVPVIGGGRTMAELIESEEPFTVDIAGVYRIHYDAEELP